MLSSYVPLLLVLSHHRWVVSLLESVASKPAGRSDFQRQREVFPKQIREIKQQFTLRYDQTAALCAVTLRKI